MDRFDELSAKLDESKLRAPVVARLKVVREQAQRNLETANARLEPHLPELLELLRIAMASRTSPVRSRVLAIHRVADRFSSHVRETPSTS